MNLPQFSAGYIQLFDTCEIAPEKFTSVDAIIAQILAGRARYEAVQATSGVPWFVIGLIHNLECSLRFDQHLHNGDPLRRPTVNDPAGRPPGWDGAGTWEQSALDALQYDRLTQVTDWDIPRILFELETFNGFGYRSRGVNSPYLWSGSQHYTSGKFIRDHVFDPQAVSDQIGAAALLHRMVTQGIVALKATAV